MSSPNVIMIHQSGNCITGIEAMQKLQETSCDHTNEDEVIQESTHLYDREIEAETFELHSNTVMSLAGREALFFSCGF